MDSTIMYRIYRGEHDDFFISSSEAERIIVLPISKTGLPHVLKQLNIEEEEISRVKTVFHNPRASSAWVAGSE